MTVKPQHMVDYRSPWEGILGNTDSPIERLFLDAFCHLADMYGYGIGAVLGEGIICVVPQYQIGDMRVDFAITYEFHGQSIRLVIECDGHDWHDRTKAQVARDKSRDRAATVRGWRALRFSGSEIFVSPSQCAFEALDEIMRFQTDVVVKAVGGEATAKTIARPWG